MAWIWLKNKPSSWEFIQRQKIIVIWRRRTNTLKWFEIKFFRNENKNFQCSVLRNVEVTKGLITYCTTRHTTITIECLFLIRFKQFWKVKYCKYQVRKIQLKVSGVMCLVATIRLPVSGCKYFCSCINLRVSGCVYWVSMFSIMGHVSGCEFLVEIIRFQILVYRY